MQQSDDLISIAAAAREIGVHRSTLSRQIADGSVRSHGGKVRLSEVIADRTANVDLGRSRRRRGEADDVDGVASPCTPVASPTPDATADATPDASAQPAGDVASTAYRDARARKEASTANLRELEFKQRSGTLVDIEEMGRLVEREYAVVRDRLLVIPGKLASHLVGLNPPAIQVALRAEIVAALEELHNPARRA